MLWLPLVDGILVHNEHIVAVANSVLVCHFAGLCGSGGVLLVEYIFKLPHALGLLYTEFLAFLVPTPLVDLRFGESGFLGDHEQRLLGPVRVLFKFSD